MTENILLKKIIDPYNDRTYDKFDLLSKQMEYIHSLFEKISKTEIKCPCETKSKDTMNIHAGNEVQITTYSELQKDFQEVSKIQSKAIQDQYKMITALELQADQLIKENHKLKSDCETLIKANEALIEENHLLKNQIRTNEKLDLLSYADSLIKRIEELEKKL